MSSIARQHAPRGTGSEMMKIICNHAVALGVTYIKGEASPFDIRLNGHRSDGEPALLYFYRKHGFQIIPGKGGFYKIRKNL